MSLKYGADYQFRTDDPLITNQDAALFLWALSCKLARVSGLYSQALAPILQTARPAAKGE